MPIAAFDMADATAQALHDALLAIKPAGVEHECGPLCPADARETAKEAGQVAADDRTFTEAEHLTLLTDRVQRETAALTAEKALLETKISELQASVDVLEAAKAAAITERDTFKTEFDTFKTDVENKAAIAERQESRVTRVKAANEGLPEDYYTPERTKRWAEMADEQFEAFVTDISAVKAPAAVKAETAAFTGGQAPTEKDKPVGTAFKGFLSARTGTPVAAAAGGEK